ALYHHFRSKEELLEAGIDRQLDRRHAMRDIRNLFAGLGDLQSELTMLGRYLLMVLDDETQLLQIASRVPAELSQRLHTAYAALFDGLYTELADWLRGWVPAIAEDEATALSAVAVNALLGKRATSTFFHPPKSDLSDEGYLAQWTATLSARIEALRAVDT